MTSRSELKASIMAGIVKNRGSEMTGERDGDSELADDIMAAIIPTVQARMEKLEDTLRWFATSGHNAYHKTGSNWEVCERPLCTHTKKVLDAQQ